ncbi:hypothetical protein AGRA3207_007541 [Actinomadura graeca]|uniref:Uncharacterized protein n=1 Tax=Actinomadura graeca TaxID=2750812 RepID=A0ABX8RDI6_9ACTN|nr:hypothetical protein [Actinomadura graeca]QXJ27053.1 hypothetical protein AGRA3207_007541 [Actinomadura graeca]
MILALSPVEAIPEIRPAPIARRPAAEGGGGGGGSSLPGMAAIIDPSAPPPQAIGHTRPHPDTRPPHYRSLFVTDPVE